MPRISKIACLVKEYKAVAKSGAVKVYIRFCLDEEDSFEDEIDDCIAAEDMSNQNKTGVGVKGD